MPYLGNQITTVFPSSVNLDTINNVAYVPNPASGQITGRRNIIINGAMKVAQRGTSETGLGASSGYFTVDRLNMGHSGNSAGRYTMTQEAITDLGGFKNAVKLACTTADTSIASNEWERIVYNIEAQDLHSLKFGTSDAEKFTVSFYVKGNASATYTLGAQSADSNRWMAKTFDVTTSWNRVSLTFEADTVGAINDDNGHGIILYITLQAGSDRTSGSIPSTWETLSAGDTADSNQTQFFDSTDRTFFITGLQMEVGSVATPFEYRSFGEELALCQRFFQQYARSSASTYRVILTGNGGSNPLGGFSYVKPMRANPSANYFGGDVDGGNFNVNSPINGSQANTAPSSITTAKDTLLWNFTSASTASQDDPHWIDCGTGTNQFSWTLDAEL